jgi:hypothetical protein
VPAYAASKYPVDIWYASDQHSCHLDCTTTEVFSTLLLTYGNGEMCSKLLFNSINRAYLERAESYYSFILQKRAKNQDAFIEQDGVFIKQYPPLGDTIRNMYNEASSTALNRWQSSDHDRNTREIQSVKCDGGIFAQDHTFEAVKNYQKSLGTKLCGMSPHQPVKLPVLFTYLQQ